MMKKITLLSLMFFAVLAAKAQTTIFSDDFNDEDISDWTLYDEDGDGQNWTVTPIQDGDGNQVRDPLLRSFSYAGGSPLTPNNYIVSPAIDLSAEDGSETISLRYDVSGADADFSDEKYTVYVSSVGNSVSDLMGGTEVVTELVTDNGPGGSDNIYTKTFDISSFAGETIYVAFRHYDVTDEFSMEIDNVEVLSGDLSIADQSFNNFNYYASQETLTISASTAFESISVYNMLGQQMINKKLADTNENINISSLSSGLYIVQVQIDGQAKSFKIVR